MKLNYVNFNNSTSSYTISHLPTHNNMTYDIKYYPYIYILLLAILFIFKN